MSRSSSTRATRRWPRRRAAALTVDPALLAELLGHGDGLALRDLLDPNALADIEAELQRRRGVAGGPATSTRSPICCGFSAR